MQSGPRASTPSRLANLRALQALDDERIDCGITETFVEVRSKLLVQLAAHQGPWSEEERNLLQSIVARDATSWQQMVSQKAELARRLQTLQHRRRDLAAAPAGWCARIRRTC